MEHSRNWRGAFSLAFWVGNYRWLKPDGLEYAIYYDWTRPENFVLKICYVMTNQNILTVSEILWQKRREAICLKRINHQVDEDESSA